MAEIREGKTYYGRVWVDDEYADPVYPSPLSMRVGEAGIKVWMVIAWLRSHGDNREAVLERYGEALKPEDVDAAIEYYEANRTAIDRKLAEETPAA